MGVNFNEINKFKSQIEFDKKRSEESLTVASINKAEIPSQNPRLSRDNLRRREYADNGFEEVFDKSLDTYRQPKK